MPRRLSFLAPAVALLLVFAGCGDDGEDVSADTTTTEQREATEAETTETDSTDERSETAEDETTTESSAPDGTTEPDGPSPTGEDAEFCATEAALDDIDDEFDPTTIEGLKAGYVALVEAAQGLGDVAPDEIANDVETVLEGLDEVGVLIADAATIEEAEAALEGFDASEIEPASDGIDEWVDENCPDDDDDGSGVSGANDDDDGA